MSKISPVYNALVSELYALFPSKTRMHNPYNLAENPAIVVKDAWGLKVESAEPVVEQYCDLSLSRQFTVTMMRQYVSLAGKEDGYDAVSVAILEDQQSVCGLLISPDELGQQSNIDQINITNVSGINELVSGEKKYLFNEVTFNILISEAIS